MFKIISTFLFVLLFLFHGSTATSKDFEGIITFRKIDKKDTTFFLYFVKNNHIRVDNVKKNGEVNGSMIINLENSSIIMLSGINNFYINVPISNKQTVDLDLHLKKTGSKKLVADKKCYLWMVTEKLSGGKIEYWVNNKYNYSFFNRMLKVLNREEPIARAWLQMDVEDNAFPLIGIHYNAAGEVVTIIEVTNIEEKDMEDNIFKLPADYELMEGQF
jgi:hypothetical protein